MKAILVKAIGLVAITASLASFTPWGGEGYEILLNNKVVVQQFGKTLNTVNNLRLTPASANHDLTVKYHRCGITAKNRTILIKDAENKVLKNWRLDDEAQRVAIMTCKVKDIINLKKGNEVILKLYYLSSDLPNGRLLTNIIVENNSLAARK